MHFTKIPYIPDATICAIATPPGEGGVAIIRISGKEALDVAERVFSGPVRSYRTHTAHFGFVVDAGGQKIDSALLLVMLGNRSYTGEDTAEIHCHGGSLIARKVLETVRQAGARLALPGEFTFKAFMNGKMDLSQAEAVQELIAAKNDYALDAAENQLQGQLSNKVRSFQRHLTEIAAILEAWVDFPEEGLEFATKEELVQQLETAISSMQQLLNTFHDGRIVHNGLTLALVGAPNSGKSSLMNALLDKERAIVSPIAGTTRDVLEDHMRLNGLNIKLMDTAGIRTAGDVIEEEGIKRSHKAIQEADLVLLVLDSGIPLSEETLRLADQLPKEKTIAIWNKIDLPHAQPLPKLDLPHVVQISAKMRLHLQELHDAIDARIWERGMPAKDEVIITKERHKEALQLAIEEATRAIEGLKGDVSPEFLTQDVRNSLYELGKIIGTDVSEDILSEIFSRFCIGK